MLGVLIRIRSKSQVVKVPILPESGAIATDDLMVSLAAWRT
jgi:hypothetical protein